MGLFYEPERYAYTCLVSLPTRLWFVYQDLIKQHVASETGTEDGHAFLLAT